MKKRRKVMSINKDSNELFRTFCSLTIILLAVLPVFALTPAEILEKGKSKILGSKSVSASFVIKIGKHNISGKLRTKGEKFSIMSNTSSSWYNGKELYTYNPISKETTITRPTASELAEVNPLLLLTRVSDYNVMGSKTKKQGLETVTLVPKKKNVSYKSATIEFDSKTFYPKNILIITSSGETIKMTLTDVQTNLNVADASFNYPASKYPGAKINDMR